MLILIPALRSPPHHCGITVAVTKTVLLTNLLGGSHIGCLWGQEDKILRPGSQVQRGRQVNLYLAGESSRCWCIVSTSTTRQLHVVPYSAWLLPFSCHAPALPFTPLLWPWTSDLYSWRGFPQLNPWFALSWQSPDIVACYWFCWPLCSPATLYRECAGSLPPS